jgi:outer membrane protein assembly factor BamD
VDLKNPQAAALFAKAQAVDSAGNTKKAIKLYQNLAIQFPYSEVTPQAIFREGELYEHEGELLDAFDAYQVLIRRYQQSGLYSQARSKQAVVAHAAADGLIENSFLWMKSRLDSKKIVEMLTTVRENAPAAASAPKAQFAIGEVLANRKNDDEAIAAFQKVVDDYPNSDYAPEAFYRVGDILLSSTAHGNQNPANLDQARHTFKDLIQTYPRSPRAADARQRVAEIDSRDIQRSFEIAAFYDKKGQTTSAAFYYQEVLRKTQSGDLHNRAQRRLQEINGTAN